VGKETSVFFFAGVARDQHGARRSARVPKAYDII
jgi:hypothetical protein